MDKPCRNVDVNNLVCNNDHPFHYCSTIDPNLGSNPHNFIHISPEEPLQDASLSNNGVKFCLLNAPSLNNKSAQFTDFICEHKPDLVAVTETWFTDKESAVKTLSTPSSYKFFDEPRLNCRGGGKIFWLLKSPVANDNRLSILNGKLNSPLREYQSLSSIDHLTLKPILLPLLCFIQSFLNTWRQLF